MQSRRLILLSLIYFLIAGCNMSTPENYFDMTVLNLNMVNGFANDGFNYQLEHPSVKMGKSSTEIIPKTRQEIVDEQVQTIEADLEKVKNLQKTDETSPLIASSLAIYEFVLPVYKENYTELATLYDHNAATDTIRKSTLLIHDKYYAHFKTLMDQLTILGKSYATKHNINVNWGTN